MSLASDSLTLRVEAEQIADKHQPQRGRIPVITDPDKVQLFLAALADGNYREVALKIAGIAKQTYYNTLKRSEAGDLQAIAFIDACEKAEAQAESEMVRNVRVASKLPQYWAAAATHLERKHPDRWGRRQDDQTTPRVVVQIGAALNDVQVNVLAQTLSPSVSQSFHSLTPSDVTKQSLINGDSVNPILEGVTAPDPAEGPVVGKAGIGLRSGVSGKGRSAGRSRKKGLA